MARPDGRARSGLHRHARARSRHVEPSLAGPKRPQDRVALLRRPQAFDEALHSKARAQAIGQRAERARSPDAKTTLIEPWRRGDRGDHQLHQHVEPERSWSAAGLLAKNAVDKGTSGQAVGQDVAGARQPGGDRISGSAPACRRISISSASIWSAMAARPVSAIPDRCPSRSPITRSTTATWSPDSVLSGNRNFEGRVHPLVRPTIWPRRRWWSPMRSPAACRSIFTQATRSAKATARRAGLSEGHLAEFQRPRSQETMRTSASMPRRCSRALRRRLQGRRGVALRSRSRPAAPMTGTTARPMCAIPPYFEGMGTRASPRR